MGKDIYDNPERKKQTLLEESSRLGFQKGVMGAPDPAESGRLLQLILIKLKRDGLALAVSRRRARAGA